MASKFTKLGAALDRQSWQWLQDADSDIAAALEAEVAQGATPDDIRRFILAHVGPDRSGLAARAMSAARYLTAAAK